MFNAKNDLRRLASFLHPAPQLFCVWEVEITVVGGEGGLGVVILPNVTEVRVSSPGNMIKMLVLRPVEGLQVLYL